MNLRLQPESMQLMEQGKWTSWETSDYTKEFVLRLIRKEIQNDIGMFNTESIGNANEGKA